MFELLLRKMFGNDMRVLVKYVSYVLYFHKNFAITEISWNDFKSTCNQHLTKTEKNVFPSK